jgi:hypothetical protein
MQMQGRYNKHMPRNWYLIIINFLGYYWPNLPGFDGKFFLQFAAGKKRVSY